VRHQDRQAGAGTVQHADHVARAPLARDGEGVPGDGETGLLERRRDLLVRALLGSARRGARAGQGEVAGEGVAGVLRATEEREGCGGGGGQHGRAR
jgi:hypothetical protein